MKRSKYLILKYAKIIFEKSQQEVGDTSLLLENLIKLKK